MRKITKRDLEEINKYALNSYLEDSAYHCNLDDKQFNAQCFLKAVIRILHIKEEFEFPKREDTTGFGDSNG